MIRGALYSVALLTVLFLLFTLLESFFYFSTQTRKVLYYAFLGVAGFSLFAWVIEPALKFYRLGRVISHEKASQIIGSHFIDIKDRLLNVLQLHKQCNDQKDNELLLASVEQKSSLLSPIPFKKAINLSENKRYLKYAAPPILLLLTLLLSSNIIEESTQRIIENNKVFEKPALFKIIIENKKFAVTQFEDYELVVMTEGKVQPSEMALEVDGYSFKMTPLENGKFTYTFKNVQKDLDFQLSSTGISSPVYELQVLKKPSISALKAALIYPNYVGKAPETIESPGDLVVPVGTVIRWNATVQQVDQLSVQFENGPLQKLAIDDAKFERKIVGDVKYRLLLENKNSAPMELAYSIKTIPDIFPSIELLNAKDSLNSDLLFYYGSVSDDYGLTKLEVITEITNEKGQVSLQRKLVKSLSEKNATYNYTLDFKAFNIAPGDKVKYYFEVFDNDGVKGPKSTKSQVFEYKEASKKEIKEQTNSNNQDIKAELNKSQRSAEKLQKDLKKLRNEILQKKDLDWKDKKEIERLKAEQNQLEKLIEEAKRKFEENIKMEDKLNIQKNEDILKKQEKINELFEDLMTDEMKEMMKELEKLMQEMNKDEMLKKMEDFQMNEAEMEKELDRMLELFKQLELENEMNKSVEELKKLAEKQETLSQKTEEKPVTPETKKAQEDIQKEFEDIQKKMDELEKQNQELSRPMDMPNTANDEKEVEEQLDNAKENLESKDSKGASQSQKKAAQKMKDMASKISDSMEAAADAAYEEDMKALRQLLENLVTLSFDQESLIDQVSKTPINTPKYTELVQQQFKVADDFTIVEDSLVALSNRIFEIQSFVEEKVTFVKQNLSSSIDELEERRTSKANVHQQKSMQGLNDIALMLDESMQKMQANQAEKKSGDQQCEKCNGNGKKGKKGKKPKLGESQEKLNQMMQQQLKEGKGGQGMSQKFAEMAAQQAALREALRKMKQELQGKGQGKEAGELQKIMDMMDKTESELVNKKLSQATLDRQKDIQSRLLEHENAQREREYDDKRESNSAQDKEPKLPPSVEEYLKKRNAEVNEYRTGEPKLKPYYKKIVEAYYNTIQSK